MKQPPLRCDMIFDFWEMVRFGMAEALGFIFIVAFAAFAFYVLTRSPEAADRNPLPRQLETTVKRGKWHPPASRFWD